VATVATKIDAREAGEFAGAGPRGTIIEYEKDRSTPWTTQAKQMLAEALRLEYDALYDNTLGAVAVKPKGAVKIGVNFGQLRRSFKKSSGLQLRCWKQILKYLLNNVETLTEEDRRSVLSCVDEIGAVVKQRKKANRSRAFSGEVN